MVSLCRTLLPQTSADMAMDLTMAPRARGGPSRCASRRRSPGQLTVQSVEGHGTTFTITLPRTARATPAC